MLDPCSVLVSHNLVIMGKNACVFLKVSSCGDYGTSWTPVTHLEQIPKLWPYVSCSSPGVCSLEEKVSMVKCLEMLHTSPCPLSLRLIKVSETSGSTLKYLKICNLLSSAFWFCNMYFSCNSHQCLSNTFEKRYSKELEENSTYIQRSFCADIREKQGSKEPPKFCLLRELAKPTV